MIVFPPKVSDWVKSRLEMRMYRVSLPEGTGILRRGGSAGEGPVAVGAVMALAIG